MDKTQSEITEKIRNAIKKKLIEINLFVDNELPDYIMILIANKRSKHHMEKDLSLFLGNQTINFTNWLWDLVNTLKAGAKSKNSTSYSSAELKLGENASESKENRADEDDVLNYDPAEEGETLCVEDLNELENSRSIKLENELYHKSEAIKSLSLQTLHKPVENSANFNLPSITPSNILHTGEIKNPQNVPSLAVSTTHPMPSIKTAQRSAKVYPMLRTKQSNNFDVQKETNRYDPTMPDYNTRGVSSVVCVSHRKYGGPAALQANKLLLRAVNDATKSVLNGKDINEYYKPTPIKELSSNKFDERIIPKTWEENLNKLKQLNSLMTLDVNKASDQDLNITASQPKRIVNLPLFSSEPDDKDSDISLQKYEHTVDQLEGEENIVAPHFIVTLDGVNFSTLKRKHSVEEPMDVDDEEDLEDYFEDTESPKKQKLSERCKYWPACKNSDSCLYHHPTVTCKAFPNCKFGDKCLYIHPNCKFDSLCSKKNCPYTHCSKRNIQAIPAPVVKPVPVPSAKTVCKYYPKCTAKSCRFIHPKLCRFGIQCRAPTCPYSHFKVPQRNQLKWKASA